MKARTLAVAGLVLLAVTGAWMVSHKEPEVERKQETKIATPAVQAPVPELRSSTAPAPDAEAPPPQPQREAARIAAKLAMANPLIPSDAVPVPAARRVADAFPEAAPDFDKIGLMFRDYRTLTGENPVGTNAEIMKALAGDNPKGAKFGPPEGQQLNAGGELIDRWGTPYFFHQLTSDRMEIRSAGPDRILWNEDDLTGD